MTGGSFGTISGSAADKNGAPHTAANIENANAWTTSGFTGKADWTIAANKLPVLKTTTGTEVRGQDSTMSGHINTAGSPFGGRGASTEPYQITTAAQLAQLATYVNGFRPKRSAHGAIKKCQENIEAGYKYVVDMDLEKYFDTVNQSKLIEVLSRTIKDGRVISLINKYLRAGVEIKHKFEET